MKAAHSLLFYLVFSSYQSTIQLTDIYWVGRNTNIDMSIYLSAYSRSISAQLRHNDFTFL